MGNLWKPSLAFVNFKKTRTQPTCQYRSNHPMALRSAQRRRWSANSGRAEFEVFLLGYRLFNQPVLNRLDVSRIGERIMPFELPHLLRRKEDWRLQHIEDHRTSAARSR